MYELCEGVSRSVNLNSEFDDWCVNNDDYFLLFVLCDEEWGGYWWEVLDDDIVFVCVFCSVDFDICGVIWVFLL